MKKFFASMLALACAMFVGVSCTPTPEGPNEPQYSVTITVDAPEVFPVAGGEQVLAYTLSSEVAGEVAWVETSAAWLTATLDEQGEYKIYLTALPCDVVAEQPREATLTVGYQDAKNVVVAVKQECQAPQFAVAYSNKTPLAADATVTILDAANQNMVWGAFTFGQSALVQGDNIMPWKAEAQLMDPTEYAKSYLADAAGPMGFGGLYLYFAQMHGYGGYLSAMAESNVINCSLYSGWGEPEEKLYLAVVGINVDPNLDLDNWVDNSSFATPVHVFEVETLPQPQVVVPSTSLSLSSAAGTHTCAVEIANPYGEVSEISAMSGAEWLEAAYADGQLTLTYSEWPYSSSRKTEVVVSYIYMCSVTMYGETMEMPIEVTTTINVEQTPNPAAEVVTFDIKVKETHFDHILVDVTPSNLNAYYRLASISNTDFNFVSPYGNGGIAGDWTKACEQNLRGEVYQGALENVRLDVSTGNCDPEVATDWEWKVFAFETDAEASVVAGAASFVDTVLVNDTPTLEWDVESLTMNVTPGSTVVVKYKLTNPVAGGLVKLNGTSVYDSYNVLENDVPVIDAENQTVTFVIAKYDTASNYHYCNITLKYTNENDDYWGITTESLKLVQEEVYPTVTCPYAESFATSIGDFVISNSSMDQTLSYVWKHDAGYGYMKASSYVGGKGLSATSYLASPVIDLTAAAAPVLTFSHAVNHSAGKMAKACTLWVKEFGKSWKEIQIPNHGTDSWTFVESGAIDLSAYAGKKIVIGFKYMAVYDSTTRTYTAPTWEIKNVSIADANGAVMPDMGL